MDRVCTQSIHVEFPIKVFYNSEVTVNLPNAGDAISKIRLVIDFANSTNTQGEEILREAELLSYGKTIEKTYGEFIKIENEFVTPIEKKVLLSNLLCEYNTGTVYLDIPFKALEPRLFAYDQIRLLFSSKGSGELKGYLLVDYNIIEGRIKDTYFQRNRKISKLLVPSVNSTSKLSIDTYIPGSVYEIWVTVKDSVTGEYIQDEVIKRVSMSVSGDERFNLNATQLRILEPLKIYGTYSRKFPVYMYSFRLKETDMFPSGQTNLTDRQRFFIEFYENNSSYDVTIWAQSHDFFYVNQESVKTVFDSEELVLGVSSVQSTGFQPINLKTSYNFYVGTASVLYQSDVEIKDVIVNSTNAPTYSNTQNEIIFTNLDSLGGQYYANVTFHAVGFSNVTCNYNFKSPKALYYDFNNSSIGFYDLFYQNQPSFFVDGNQRINEFYSSTLNGVNLGGNNIKNVLADQYRNYLVSRQDSLTKYSSDLSSIEYVVNSVTGIPSAYFGTDTIPVSNAVYTYTSNILTNTNTIEYCNLHASATLDGGISYVTGTTFNSNPILFDGTVTDTRGSGTKSILVKYVNGNYTYSIIADQNSGPTSLCTTSTGPVFMFPVTSSSKLYAENATYSYASSGISLTQLASSNGSNVWSYTISAPSLVIGKCASDTFDNVYFSYSDVSNFYLVKLANSGSLKWSRSFTLLSKMDFGVSQDVTYVTYRNSSGSSVLFTSDSRKINVPAGYTGVDLLDSDGNLVTFYGTPVSNVTDFTNKTLVIYDKPLFSGEYFSSNTSSTSTKINRNYWGIFINGIPSVYSKPCDDNGTSTVFTGQYGPALSNIFPWNYQLPSVINTAAFIVNVKSSNSKPNWVSYIENIVNTYNHYSVNITSSGNVYASGTYGSYRSNIYNSDETMFAGYLPALNDYGVYLVKYNSSGFALWQTYMDGVGSDNFSYNIVQRYSNIYVLCNSDGASTITAYNAKFTGDRVPTSSGFSTLNRTSIIKYDGHTGQAQWITSVPTAQPADICLDSKENFIFSFNYFDYGPSKFKQSDNTNFGPVFSYRSVLKATPGGFGILGFYADVERIQSVYTSPVDDSILICGMFNNNYLCKFYEWDSGTSSIVDSGKSVNPTRAYPSASQGFIAKYSSVGKFLWRAYIIHPNIINSYEGNIDARRIACDSNGNIYVAGTYSNYVNPTTVYSSNDSAFPVSLTKTGTGSGNAFDVHNGGFLVKFDSNGICQWVIDIDNIIEFYPGLHIDSNNNVILSGYYYGRDIKFYDSNGGEHNSYQPASDSDILTYCVKYDTNGFLLPL